MSRRCINDRDSFCYTCGEFVFKESRKTIDELYMKAYYHVLQNQTRRPREDMGASHYLQDMQRKPTTLDDRQPNSS